MRMTYGLAALALASAAAVASANDAYQLHKLYGERLAEDASTRIMTLGSAARAKPVVVLRVSGPIRQFAITFLDARAEYAPPLMSKISPFKVWAGADVRAKISRHPVVRYEGSVDCRNGDLRWKSMAYADGATTPAVIVEPIAFAQKMLMKHLPTDDLDTLCSMAPVT